MTDSIIKTNILVVLASNLYCKLMIACFLAGVELLLSRNSKTKIRINFQEACGQICPKLSIDCLFTRPICCLSPWTAILSLIYREPSRQYYNYSSQRLHCIASFTIVKPYLFSQLFFEILSFFCWYSTLEMYFEYTSTCTQHFDPNLTH